MSVPLLFKAVVVAGLATAGVGYAAVSHDSVGAGVSVVGPVCVKHTVHPGDTVTVMASIVNGSGATTKISVSTDPVVGQPLTPFPPGGHPIYKQLDHPAGKTWAEVSGPYMVPPRTTIQAPVTIHILDGAPRGRYGTMIYAHSFGHPRGSGDQVAAGAGAGAYFAMSVGVPPPPHCGGQQDWPWASGWKPPLPWCTGHQAPVQGRQAMCLVRPLPPPPASARNCHLADQLAGRKMSAAANGKAWRDYEKQLRIAQREGLPGGPRYAHCAARGRALATTYMNRRSGMYRWANTGQYGPIRNAPPANNPDSWRAPGSS